MQTKKAWIIGCFFLEIKYWKERLGKLGGLLFNFNNSWVGTANEEKSSLSALLGLSKKKEKLSR